MTVAPKGQLEFVKDLQHPGSSRTFRTLSSGRSLIRVDDARLRRTDQTRNVTLIPTVVANRLHDQFAAASKQGRGLGKITQQFRSTVLPYSTHWMQQIASEAGLRSLVAGALDPRYLTDGRRLMKRLTATPEGQAALTEMTQATLYNAHDPYLIHNPNMGKTAAAAHAFPPTHVLIGAHKAYASFIGGAMHGLESQFRTMGNQAN